MELTLYLHLICTVSDENYHGQDGDQEETTLFLSITMQSIKIVVEIYVISLASIPVDLKHGKALAQVYCQIEIHFSIQTTKFLMKYNLRCFQIVGGLIIFFTKYDHSVSTSFIKENTIYK